MMMTSDDSPTFQLSFLGILFSFLAILIAAPLATKVISSIIISIFFVSILLFSVSVLSSDKKTLFFGIILTFCSFTFLGISFIKAPWWMHLHSQITAALLAGLTITVHFKKILYLQEYNSNTIFATICVFLLLGFFFSLIYEMIEHIHPGSFEGIAFSGKEPKSYLDLSASLNNFLYFSFVTQTTLGYGDVTPKIALAQNLSVIQAIMGQFYIAVLVAGIIGKILRESERGLY